MLSTAFVLYRFSADLTSSKELFTDRKTKSSDWKMQHVDALDESTRYDKVRDLTDQLWRSKRRCAKLGRQLQEKELQIQSMQEQQQLHFPLLMHETIRNLQLLDGNLSDERQTASAEVRSSLLSDDRVNVVGFPNIFCVAFSVQPLSHSVTCFMAHNRQDVDVCMHEYEQQVGLSV